MHILATFGKQYGLKPWPRQFVTTLYHSFFDTSSGSEMPGHVHCITAYRNSTLRFLIDVQCIINVQPLNSEFLPVRFLFTCYVGPNKRTVTK